MGTSKPARAKAKAVSRPILLLAPVPSTTVLTGIPELARTADNHWRHVSLCETRSMSSCVDIEW